MVQTYFSDGPFSVDGIEGLDPSTVLLVDSRRSKCAVVDFGCSVDAPSAPSVRMYTRRVRTSEAPLPPAPAGCGDSAESRAMHQRTALFRARGRGQTQESGIACVAVGAGRAYVSSVGSRLFALDAQFRNELFCCDSLPSIASNALHLYVEADTLVHGLPEPPQNAEHVYTREYFQGVRAAGQYVLPSYLSEESLGQVYLEIPWLQNPASVQGLSRGAIRLNAAGTLLAHWSLLYPTTVAVLDATCGVALAVLVHKDPVAGMDFLGDTLYIVTEPRSPAQRGGLRQAFDPSLFHADLDARAGCRERRRPLFWWNAAGAGSLPLPRALGGELRGLRAFAGGLVVQADGCAVLEAQ